MKLERHGLSNVRKPERGLRLEEIGFKMEDACLESNQNGCR
jgi:hypothetical protein